MKLKHTKRYGDKFARELIPHGFKLALDYAELWNQIIKDNLSTKGNKNQRVQEKKKK